ncbi:MAG: hypothetical protein J6S75_07510, partial [Thermoguttaceae bacterium]|nr:hypothetical protein [Thermoguttaceae bacterium]
KRESQQATVMIVEANPEMQNVFRESLKRLNLRVLVVSSTERALERFDDNDQNISCVLFNAQSLGSSAVVAFNKLSKNRLTADIPAILLLDESQTKWSAKAVRAKHRVAVGMPISMRRLQEVMLKLISNKHKADRPDASAPAAAAGPTGEPRAEDKETSKTAVGLPASSTAFIDPEKSGSLPAPEKTSIVPRSDLASAAGVEAGSQDDSEIFGDLAAAPTSSAEETKRSNLDLSGSSESSDDYVAYMDESSASAVKTGTFSRTLFEEALNDAVDALVLKIQQDDTDTEDEEVDDISGLTREEFLAGNTGEEDKDEESDSDDYGDDDLYEDDDED